MTASAAGKPNLSVANISDGQKISWSSTGAQKYYLYFGVYDYNTRKTEWRVYREVNGATFTINNKSLHSSGWKRYVNYKSTPYLTSGQAYCYQIHAGNVNTNGRPIDNRYSKVRSMTYAELAANGFTPYEEDKDDPEGDLGENETPIVPIGPGAGGNSGTTPEGGSGGENETPVVPMT